MGKKQDKDNSVLEVNVADAINTEDVMGDNLQQEQQLVPYLETPSVGRPVTDEDVPRILEAGQEMIDLCFMPYGKYLGSLIITHTQIEDKDPLNFFVVNSGEVIVNPKVVKHTEKPVDKMISSNVKPFADPKEVPVYNKIEIEYQSISTEKKLTKVKTQSLSGNGSAYTQVAIAMLKGKHIHMDDYSPEWALSDEATNDLEDK